MRNFVARLSHQARIFADDRSGSTAIEYSLIASLISIVIIVAVGLIGESVQQFFNSVAASL